MNGQVNILDVAHDPKIFGRWFKGETWGAWLAFLATLFALPLDDTQLALYRKHTGRQTPPSQPFREGWVLVGRRGGKSLVAALVAVFLAFFRDYSAFLAPGEMGTVMVVAADRRQARVIFRYVRGFIQDVPMLAAMVVRETKESLELSNRVVIEIHTSNFKSVRGYSCVACCNDEVCYWPVSDSAAEPDRETLIAQRPTLATIPGSLLLSISTGYGQSGEMFRAFKEHYGKEDSGVLFWKAASREMNPQLDQEIINEAYARDPVAAASEYGGDFRTDVESFIGREAVEACIVAGRYELPRVAGIRYFGFVDPSGGSGDAMTLAVAHSDKSTGRFVLDCLRERRPPFSPDAVVKEFAETLRDYGITRVIGDRYAGEWPRERFRVHGIEYVPSEKVRSDLYLELLPLINSGRIELLENQRLLSQLVGLERRTARGGGGRDSVDHRPGAHDDTANAGAGALVEAASHSSNASRGRACMSSGGVSVRYDLGDKPPTHPAADRIWRGPRKTYL